MNDEKPHVKYTVTDGVAIVLLDRPEKLNSLTGQMERELIECFDRSDADDDVRAVVVTGAGRAFCAGLDLAAGTDPRDTFTDWRRSPTAPPGPNSILTERNCLSGETAGRVALRIFDSRKPVISAINGHAVGVGATMTLATDIRVASEDAKFAFPFTRREFVPESCAS
ncbi:enoyl-CoA hydratase-related protein [Rhodococcus sp. (in: high G+C Gram-positive bacteria)]|uniref:enoyl-CoA hydratase-related protein n=1 Tax=Rhodococcus sp. TaxID=1831 RepID=UPI00257FF16D|nr:enoyl-CoA hydratase-related protein [Rhodococcus sp. (in: high G+C Gram-positive bacteria)]